MPSGTTAQLFIHPPMIVMGGADNQQPACGNHPGACWRIGMFAAKPYIRAPAGHCGGDRHRARSAGLSDDLGFAGVMLGVKDGEGAA